MTKIDNIKDKKCCVCNKSLKKRFNFHNEEAHIFKNIKMFESAHLECYIEICVYKYLGKVNANRET